jgi:serine/threonine-protein kinase RsbW
LRGRRRPAMQNAEIRIANQLTEISRVVDALEAFARSHGLSDRVRHDVSIAVDEVISNIIHHSYRDDAAHSITVRLTLVPGELHAEIVDDGAAFDPVVHDTPRPSGSVEERELGGLGLHLVKSLMDNVCYVRLGNSNHLTLIKKTAGPGAVAGGGSAMRLSVTNENGVTIVGISGRFDSAVAGDIRERVTQLIGAGAKRMLLNLYGVEYISSAGFWALLAIGKEMEARRGRFVLCGVGDEVKRLFDLSGFAGLFRIFPTRELGLNAVRESAE